MAFALDVETKKNIERLARHWKVSRSKALQKAVRVALEEERENGGLLPTLDEFRKQKKRRRIAEERDASG